MSARSGKSWRSVASIGLNSSRERPWTMKRFRTKMAILAISFATAGPLLADDLPVRNCTWCHGMSAQGYSKAPRLAGQRVDYLVNQLQAFATHKRDEFLSTKYMWYAAANLDPLTVRNLAAYLSALPPEAAKDGDSELVAEGRIIFENGVPDENIAACQACHGPEAQGVREFRASAGSLTAISSVGLSSGARAMTLGGYLCRKSHDLCRQSNRRPRVVFELCRRQIFGEID